MNFKSQELLNLWKAGRTVFEKNLASLKEEDLSRRISPESNSIGFLLRHIGEAEHNFANMFFGMATDFEKKTLGPVKDQGLFTSGLPQLLKFVEEGRTSIESSILQTPDAAWNEQVETRMGTFKRSESIGRLIYHTNWHAGQISLILKYGK